MSSIRGEASRTQHQRDIQRRVRAVHGLIETVGGHRIGTGDDDEVVGLASPRLRP